MSFGKLLLRAAATALAGRAIGYMIGKDEEEKKRLANKGTLIGGGLGLGYSILNYEPADTVNYTLKNKGKRVYHGIAYEDRIDNRLFEHEVDGKVFDDVVVGQAKTRSSALETERLRIKRHKPKYNIHHNC